MLRIPTHLYTLSPILIRSIPSHNFTFSTDRNKPPKQRLIKMNLKIDDDSR